MMHDDITQAAAAASVHSERRGVSDAIDLLRTWQTWLGSSPARCDEQGKKLWSRIDAACEALAAAPSAPADPCPGCIKGGVCKTIACGRLRSSELMNLYGTAVPVGDGWLPIETAPKDGRHILIKSPTMPPTTVHWFDGDWHLSVNQRGEYSNYIWCGPNYWLPLDALPAARKEA